ncbi:hypothetical protein TWF481_010380 [Arthrobotrys musiformis]|uniref:C2H2-type domain-containing protein n=1 Tax=Arthrobotrys musiformis TaxID=47236 RepID=A0AAV9W0N4_9PEZI
MKEKTEETNRYRGNGEYDQRRLGRRRPACPFHFDSSGRIIVGFNSTELLWEHIRISGCTLPSGYKCEGGAGKICEKVWEKGKKWFHDGEWKLFTKHIATYHRTSDPKDPKFQYGVGADGYYCGFCVKKVSTNTHRTIIDHLQSEHYKDGKHEDVRTWVRFSEVDMQSPEAARAKNREAVAREDRILANDAVRTQKLPKAEDLEITWEDGLQSLSSGGLLARFAIGGCGTVEEVDHIVATLFLNPGAWVSKQKGELG